MNIVPMIAKRWDISDDGLTYIFFLRNDIRFHQDTCFDRPRYLKANDVVYSFNRVVDKHLNSPGAWVFSQVRHDDQGYAFKALDDTTFQVELSQPFPPFLGIKPMMKSMLQRTCSAEKMLIKNLNLPRDSLIQELKL